MTSTLQVFGDCVLNLAQETPREQIRIVFADQPALCPLDSVFIVEIANNWLISYISDQQSIRAIEFRFPLGYED